MQTYYGRVFFYPEVFLHTREFTLIKVSPSWLQETQKMEYRTVIKILLLGGSTVAMDIRYVRVRMHLNWLRKGSVRQELQYSTLPPRSP